jgi:F0F1-type ATP synthase membrane subunit c/vacuolar-type H+-ATPase subunit K
LLFIKAAKILAFASAFLPITGCAIGTGLIYSALIRGCAYAPEMEETMFNYATLGFAFVETFAFIVIGSAVAVTVL